MDTIEYENYRKNISPIYVGVRKLLRNTGADQIITDSKIYEENNLFKFRIWHNIYKNTYRCIKSKMNKSVPQFNHIIVGIYIPDSKVGDIINIVANGSSISKIKITAVNRFYLPIDNQYFLNVAALQFTTVFIECYSEHENIGNLYSDKDVYILSTDIPPESRKYMVSYPIYISLRESSEQIIYLNGCIYRLSDYNVDQEFKNKYIAENDIVNRGYVNIIENTYINKKNFLKWRNNVKIVNDSIKYMPDLGVEYYKSFKNFQKMQQIKN